MPKKPYPVTLIGTEILIPLLVSFESGEAGVMKLPALTFRCRLKSVKTCVQKALAGTDAGTVTVKKNNTGSAYATVTIPLSSAIATETAAPTPTDTPFEMTDQITITTAKPTAGGKALVYLSVEVLPSH